jgi:hypothetical protein
MDNNNSVVMTVKVVDNRSMVVSVETSRTFSRPSAADHTYAAVTSTLSSNFSSFIGSPSVYRHKPSSSQTNLRSPKKLLLPLLPEEGETTSRRGTFVRSSSPITLKANPAFTIHSKDLLQGTISSYETSNLTQVQSPCSILGTQLQPMSLENVFFTGVESREAPLEISSQEGQTNNIITPTDSMKARKATTTSSLAIAPSGKRLMTKSENAITDFFENWNDILDIDIDQSEAIAAPADDSHNFLPDLDLFPEIKMEIDEDKIQEFVEVILPVVHVQEDLKKEEAVDHVWSQDSMLGSGFGTDPMACYNPMEAEGIVNEAVGLATEADEASNDLDLLNFVLDDTLHPDDPAFQEFIANDDLSTIDFGDIFGPSTSTAEIKIELPDDDDDVDYEEQPPAKRGRGRPRMPRTFPEPPRYFSTNKNLKFKDGVFKQ